MYDIGHGHLAVSGFNFRQFSVSTNYARLELQLSQALFFSCRLLEYTYPSLLNFPKGRKRRCYHWTLSSFSVWSFTVEYWLIKAPAACWFVFEILKRLNLNSVNPSYQNVSLPIESVEIIICFRTPFPDCTLDLKPSKYGPSSNTPPTTRNHLRLIVSKARSALYLEQDHFLIGLFVSSSSFWSRTQPICLWYASLLTSFSPF